MVNKGKGRFHFVVKKLVLPRPILDSRFAFAYTPGKSDLPADAIWRGIHLTTSTMAVRQKAALLLNGSWQAGLKCLKLKNHESTKERKHEKEKGYRSVCSSANL